MTKIREGPTYSMWAKVTRSISGSSSSAASTRRRVSGATTWPMRNWPLRTISRTATTPRSTPTRIDPTASQTASPVTSCSTRPPAASRMPTSAAASSKKTARSVVWLVSRTKRIGRICIFAAPARVCRTACTNDTPSSTKATASTE